MIEGKLKSECTKCKSENTCLDAPREDCPDFRETDEARRNRIESEVKAHDERVRRQLLVWLLDEEPEFRLWDVLYNRKPSADDVLAVFNEDGM